MRCDLNTQTSKSLATA